MRREEMDARSFLATKVILALWTISSFVTILIVKGIFPNAVPFGLFEFWRTQKSLLLAVRDSLLLFIWGIGVNLVIIFIRKTHIANPAQVYLGEGLIRSTLAALQEEILFRWLAFLNAIWAVKLTNWLFFGWLGLGIPKIIYSFIRGFIANVLTLGRMHSILYHPKGWFVGAALLATNIKFRDGHKYQGWFGHLNSWFVGMYLFWLLFNYGVVACLIVHFLYDMLIFFTYYLIESLAPKSILGRST